MPWFVLFLKSFDPFKPNLNRLIGVLIEKQITYIMCYSCIFFIMPIFFKAMSQSVVLYSCHLQEEKDAKNEASNFV